MLLVEVLTKVSLLSFLVSGMLALGLGLTLGQIAEPLRNPRAVVVALVLNFVLMPLFVLGLVKMLRLDEPLGVGLLLLGAAAGAPFLPMLARLAKGNLPYSVALMVLLMLVTIVFLPIALPLLLPGVTVNPLQIAKSLVILMLVPLGIGLFVKSKFANLAARAKPPLDKLSSLSLVVFVVLMIATNIGSVLQIFGTRGLLAGLLLVAAAFGSGWLLGGPDRDMKKVLALGTSQRNIAAALVIGLQSFSDDPKVEVMVIVTAIVGLIVLLPVARALGKPAKGHLKPVRKHGS